MIPNNKEASLERERLHKLLINSDPYLSCDDCFEQVDKTVEKIMKSGDKLSPEFKAHLLACGACHEEALALAELIAAEHGKTPDQAAEIVEAALV